MSERHPDSMALLRQLAGGGPRHAPRRAFRLSPWPWKIEAQRPGNGERLAVVAADNTTVGMMLNEADARIAAMAPGMMLCCLALVAMADELTARGWKLPPKAAIAIAVARQVKKEADGLPWASPQPSAGDTP
ncbi:MAG: hypothetical protein AB7O80_10925 [Acetobacteraceae bacterium]